MVEEESSIPMDAAGEMGFKKKRKSLIYHRQCAAEEHK